MGHSVMDLIFSGSTLTPSLDITERQFGHLGKIAHFLFTEREFGHLGVELIFF